ncbi:MAG: hypothetical protein MUE30_20005, partial [Spirosomaceae bacterium]|nr:hypothetical protein [Spirosomataceae bacterium]
MKKIACFLFFCTFSFEQIANLWLIGWGSSVVPLQIPTSGVFAQTKVTNDSLQTDIARALAYLAAEQVKSPVLHQAFVGEWPAYMQMHTRFVLLGTRRKARDSNCFTTAAVHNTLAEMYLADTSLRQILPMLRAAYPEILTYATGQQFNFWKKLPPYRDLQRGPEPNPVPWVRRPTHYRLQSRYINNA